MKSFIFKKNKQCVRKSDGKILNYQKFSKQKCKQGVRGFNALCSRLYKKEGELIENILGKKITKCSVNPLTGHIEMDIV